MSLCERARWHVLIPLLRAATCPPTFPTGLKNRNSFIIYILKLPFPQPKPYLNCLRHASHR